MINSFNFCRRQTGLLVEAIMRFSGENSIKEAIMRFSGAT